MIRKFYERWSTSDKTWLGHAVRNQNPSNIPCLEIGSKRQNLDNSNTKYSFSSQSAASLQSYNRSDQQKQRELHVNTRSCQPRVRVQFLQFPHLLQHVPMERKSVFQRSFQSCYSSQGARPHPLSFLHIPPVHIVSPTPIPPPAPPNTKLCHLECVMGSYRPRWRIGTLGSSEPQCRCVTLKNFRR